MNKNPDDVLPGQESLLDLIEAERQRDEAMAQAEAHADPDWLERARAVVLDVARIHDSFTADDVWSFLEKPREPRALGPVLKGLAQEGLIHSTGQYRKSTRRHAAAVVVWRKA